MPELTMTFDFKKDLILTALVSINNKNCTWRYLMETKSSVTRISNGISVFHLVKHHHPPNRFICKKSRKLGDLLDMRMKDSDLVFNAFFCLQPPCTDCFHCQHCYWWSVRTRERQKSTTFLSALRKICRLVMPCLCTSPFWGQRRWELRYRRFSIKRL